MALPALVPSMTEEALEAWLRVDDPDGLAPLYAEADRVRRETVGDGVHLRGLIEFSNHCARRCGYCGLSVEHQAVVRYRMTDDEILECARKARDFGYGTVVLQSGEDFHFDGAGIASLVRAIKEETGLAITLSLGERSDDDLTRWRETGADRYLLRFETSNEALFHAIHPPLGETASDRIALLRRLRELGYEVGSGVMLGIPGQSYADLARDVALFRELDLDMIGVGPFIPHPATPLGQAIRGERDGAAPGADAPSPSAPPAPPRLPRLSAGDQVPAVEEMAYKVVALARIVCPLANIPSTSAVATLNKATGRELGLQRGANVVMPNLTPRQYRALYAIYPAKACLDETAEECRTCMRGRIHSIGRHVAQGPGHSPNRLRRAEP